MSTDPTNLLRMLEPAVRPDGRSSGVSGVARRGAETTPFEQQSFDQLLIEAKQGDPAESADKNAPATTMSRSLALLGDLTHIENASLRLQLEARANASQQGTASHASTSDSTL